MSEQISTALEQFLRGRLPSWEQVDIVLLLRGDKSRRWTAPEVARELGTPPESTAMRLFLLASNGLVLFDGGGTPSYRYADLSEHETLIDELARAKADNAAALRAIVGGAAPDPLRSFSDAFRMKR